MLISESSLSYIMVGTLLGCAVRNEGVLALLWKTFCRSAKQSQMSIRKQGFPFKKTRLFVKFQLLMAWIIAIEDFHLGGWKF